ncbi:unnamed protein product [Calypogeia fissa]
MRVLLYVCKGRGKDGDSLGRLARLVSVKDREVSSLRKQLQAQLQHGDVHLMNVVRVGGSSSKQFIRASQ